MCKESLVDIFAIGFSARSFFLSQEAIYAADAAEVYLQLLLLLLLLSVARCMWLHFIGAGIGKATYNQQLYKCVEGASKMLQLMEKWDAMETGLQKTC